MRYVADVASRLPSSLPVSSSRSSRPAHAVTSQPNGSLMWPTLPLRSFTRWYMTRLTCGPLLLEACYQGCVPVNIQIPQFHRDRPPNNKRTWEQEWLPETVLHAPLLFLQDKKSFQPHHPPRALLPWATLTSAPLFQMLFDHPGTLRRTCSFPPNMLLALPVATLRLPLHEHHRHVGRM